MNLLTEAYLAQVARWPQTGRHILAQFDETSVVVYQAYRPAIGHYAASHGHFGGEFSFSRMSWIKTNFLWMMFRSGWGSKPGQEVVLAVQIKRSAFDAVLAEAVHSTYVQAVYGSEHAWKEALESSDVRLQWDPDHDPSGAPVERRAIQLGLRGRTLHAYAEAAILDLEDITDFVAEQRGHAVAPFTDLMIPAERVLTPAMPRASANVGLDVAPEELP